MTAGSWARAGAALAIACALSACGQGAAPQPQGPALVPLRAAAGDSASILNQDIDSYDPATNTLTIPLVQVGIRYYRDVRATVGPIVSIGTASNVSGMFDRYDPATNELTAPVVRVGTTVYFNVVAKAGVVLSVGGEVASYSVPTDLSLVTYPQSYQTVTSDAADINTDPCRLDIARVNYPATWMGRYPLPAVTGAPLKTGIKRSVMLKDVGLQPGNPGFIYSGAPGAPQGCTGDLRTALARTVQRLKLLGTDYLQVTQWHWATNKPDGSWTFTRAEDTFGAITDADLAFLVQQAHAAGIKVVMLNQIQGYFDSSNPSSYYVPPSTMDNWVKWFGAYQAYILERAPVFQAMGVDVWEAGCSVCMYYDTGDGSQAAISYFSEQYGKALDNMKTAFTGQTLMNYNPGLDLRPELAARLDVLGMGTYIASFPADLTDNLTVARYRALVESNGLQNNLSYIQSRAPGKTIMITYGIQSRADMFTKFGYMEETACTPGFGSFDTSPFACIERETHTDFSMQAIVHEASLEAINALAAGNSTLMVNVLDYWESDSLMPFTAFPQIAYSIRNKPAEGVVKAWFAR